MGPYLAPAPETAAETLWLRRFPRCSVTTPGDHGATRPDPEEPTLGLWRTLPISLALSVLGFWAPLGFLIWRWFR